MRRRIEIVAIERERILQHSIVTRCPVCLEQTELLTLNQAAALAQVEAAEIELWLVEKKSHGGTMHDDRPRICKNSLFIDKETRGE